MLTQTIEKEDDLISNGPQDTQISVNIDQNAQVAKVEENKVVDVKRYIQYQKMREEQIQTKKRDEEDVEEEKTLKKKVSQVNLSANIPFKDESMFG